MNKLMAALLILLIPLGCSADTSDCTLQADMVKKQQPIKNVESVASSQWDAGFDKDGEEFRKTLRIIFKNGDYAVIEHKYCLMYNFEINYFRSRQSDDLDVTSIAKVIAGMYTEYFSAPKKVKFPKSIEDIVAATLKQRGFQADKDFLTGLPDDGVSYPNMSVEYSLRYKSFDEFSSIYSSATKFYMGIGGQQ